jgi:hypothetical protein
MIWTSLMPLKRGGLSGIPKEAGIYRVVAQEPFGRLRGESAIIYIGCSWKGKQGLWLEIGNLLNPQRQHIYTLKPLLNSNVELEYQYLTASPEDARDIEYHLLDIYEKKHLELPPRNQSKPTHTKCKYCRDDRDLQNLY